MMLKKEQYRWVVLGALILFLIIFSVRRRGNKDEVQTPDQSIGFPTSTAVVATATPAVKDAAQVKSPVIKKPSIPTGQTASEAYLQALSTYQKSGYYMQFFPCQASPGSMILKKGSKVMLDNRDSVAHIIGIRSVRYNIGSYNFAIATLDSLGTNYVTCDGGGSAQITVVP